MGSTRAGTESGKRALPVGANIRSSGGKGAPPWNQSRVMGAAQQYLGHQTVSDRSTASTGLDSAGLAQLVCQRLGKHVPRTVGGQYGATYRVTPDAYRPGDLVFFLDTGGGKGITHVGVYVGNGKFIHASEGTKTVIMDSLDTKYNKIHLDSVRRPDTANMQRANAEQSAERARQRRIGTYENPGGREVWQGLALGLGATGKVFAEKGRDLAALAAAVSPGASISYWLMTHRSLAKDIAKWNPNKGGPDYPEESQMLVKLGFAPLEMYLQSYAMGLAGAALAPATESIAATVARQPAVVRGGAKLLQHVISGNLPTAIHDVADELQKGGGARGVVRRLRKDFPLKAIAANTVADGIMSGAQAHLPKNAVDGLQSRLADMSPGVRSSISALAGGGKGATANALSTVLNTATGDRNWGAAGESMRSNTLGAFTTGMAAQAFTDAGSVPYWSTYRSVPRPGDTLFLRSKGMNVRISDVDHLDDGRVMVSYRPVGSKQKMTTPVEKLMGEERRVVRLAPTKQGERYEVGTSREMALVQQANTGGKVTYLSADGTKHVVWQHDWDKLAKRYRGRLDSEPGVYDVQGMESPIQVLGQRNRGGGTKIDYRTSSGAEKAMSKHRWVGAQPRRRQTSP